MNLEEIHKCDHCGAKAGKVRPVGKYIVELHSFEDEEGLKLLCITCFKQYRRMALKAAKTAEQSNVEHGFFEGLINVYRKAFSAQGRESY